MPIRRMAWLSRRGSLSHRAVSSAGVGLKGRGGVPAFRLRTVAQACTSGGGRGGGAAPPSGWLQAAARHQGTMSDRSRLAMVGHTIAEESALISNKTVESAISDEAATEENAAADVQRVWKAPQQLRDDMRQGKPSAGQEEFVDMSKGDGVQFEKSFKRNVVSKSYLTSSERAHLTNLIFEAFYREEGKSEDDPAMLYQAGLELTWIEEWVDGLMKTSSPIPEDSTLRGLQTDGDARRAIKRAVLERVELRKPLSYIIGFHPFFGCNILCKPPLLCPRSETEMWTHWLVRAHLSRLSTQKPLNVLDMCCGTGCIGVAIAKQIPQARVWAVDILPEAIQVSLENARRNKISGDRYTAIQSNLFECFTSAVNTQETAPSEAAMQTSEIAQQPCDVKSTGSTAGCEGSKRDHADSKPRVMQIADAYRNSFDLIVCNPPYVLPTQYDSLPCTTKHWESKMALVGDEYRETRQYLYFQELCEYGAAMLRRGRLRDAELRHIPNLVVEVGLQAELVASLMEKSKLWESVEVHLDYAQQPRWITATSVH